MNIVKHAGALLVLAVAQMAGAQNFPTKPVRLLVGGGAGGAADTTARITGPKLGEIWRQQVVVDHRPTAGGIVAAGIVAKSAPDGHTLLICSVATHGIGPAVNKKLPYDHIKDFTPISRVGTVPNVLVVHPSVPAKSVKEFISYAKANPGKLQYPSSGAGNSPQLTMELLKVKTGINVAHVSIAPDVPANDEVASGRVTANFGNVPGALPFAKAGKLRAVGVTSAKRHALFPDVPTFIESGVSDFEVTVWSGVCAPAAAPKATITKINGDLVKVLSTTEARKALAERGIDAASSTPEQFAAFIKSETARWAQAAKSAGIVPK